MESPERIQKRSEIDNFIDCFVDEAVFGEILDKAELQSILLDDIDGPNLFDSSVVLKIEDEINGCCLGKESGVLPEEDSIASDIERETENDESSEIFAILTSLLSEDQTVTSFESTKIVSDKVISEDSDSLVSLDPTVIHSSFESTQSLSRAAQLNQFYPTQGSECCCQVQDCESKATIFTLKAEIEKLRFELHALQSEQDRQKINKSSSIMFIAVNVVFFFLVCIGFGCCIFVDFLPRVL